ncbi:MAG: galactose oxidase [Lutibacter sp.]|nr:galactose oxidase [Lutibacter sp.]
MNLKKMYLKSAILLLLIGLVSCSSDDDDMGNWVESSSFDGYSRANSAAFVINDKGYIVAGYDGDDYMYDLWEYDKDGDYWVQKADFPGIPRTAAVGFSLHGKGYFGTGYDGDDEVGDFWCYDPASNMWTQKADFGGTARTGAIGFAVSGKGYIGTGYDGSELKDFWQYNDATNEWTQLYGFGGNKRRDAAVFVIDDLAYVGTGIQNGRYQSDFYVFDGISETWKRLRDLDDDDEDYKILLSNGVGFSLNGFGYITTGAASGISTNLWEYNPLIDKWDDRPDFEGAARQDANSFSFSDKAFVLMGRSGGYYFDDNWEYRPDEESDLDD